MLYYTDANWDENSVVTDAVHKVIGLFGADRAFFCSNFPTDLNAKWPADRLFSAFDELTSKYSDADRRKLFSESARKAYRVE